MGGFYGSIQVRTTDRAAVKAAAEAVAKERSIRCLIGPEMHGWVCIWRTMSRMTPLERQLKKSWVGMLKEVIADLPGFAVSSVGLLLNRN
jgi:hypothetical protein